MSYRILALVAATDTGVEHVVEEVTDEHATTTDAHAAEATTAHAEETTTHAAEGEHAAEEAQGIAALGLDPIAIGAQLITFLILFVVVKKFALGGIVKNLQKRHEDINRGLHLASEMDKQKADLDSKVEDVLRAARKDADNVIAEAQNESGKIVQAAEESANRRAEEIIRAAEGKIERDIADARKGLRAEMAVLITEATEAILQEKLDSAGDKKLVEKYMKDTTK